MNDSTFPHNRAATISAEELAAFLALRELVFEYAAEMSARKDGSTTGKSDDGTLTLQMPSWWSDGTFTLGLAHYSLGPYRHTYWEGKTLWECLGKAATDVRNWIAQDRQEAQMPEAPLPAALQRMVDATLAAAGPPEPLKIQSIAATMRVETFVDWERAAPPLAAEPTVAEQRTLEPPGRVVDPQNPHSVCKGHWDIGNNCGRCPKCIATFADARVKFHKGLPSASQVAALKILGGDWQRVYHPLGIVTRITLEYQRQIWRPGNPVVLVVDEPKGDGVPLDVDQLMLPRYQDSYYRPFVDDHPLAWEKLL